MRFTTLFAQGTVLVPAANPLGALFSGGLTLASIDSPEPGARGGEIQER